jgi:hypothetical protein
MWALWGATGVVPTKWDKIVWSNNGGYTWGFLQGCSPNEGPRRGSTNWGLPRLVSHSGAPRLFHQVWSKKGVPPRRFRQGVFPEPKSIKGESQVGPLSGVRNWGCTSVVQQEGPTREGPNLHPPLRDAQGWSENEVPRGFFKFGSPKGGLPRGVKQRWVNNGGSHKVGTRIGVNQGASPSCSTKGNSPKRVQKG